MSLDLSFSWFPWSFPFLEISSILVLSISEFPIIKFSILQTTSSNISPFKLSGTPLILIFLLLSLFS
ncbi:unnamed protein product [Staurois parvus]|uniref:ATP synthase F0 subunit 8 n=1 Tax=Staurois parvus TaxID=386267 RepID=A0ABN9G5U7_9NEOB|nr:unnamed protein product [Staurois parvus]